MLATTLYPYSAEIENTVQNAASAATAAVILLDRYNSIPHEESKRAFVAALIGELLLQGAIANRRKATAA